MTEKKAQSLVSEKQIGLALKRFKTLFSSVGSVAIDFISDYGLLVAGAKDDGSPALRASAHAELDRVLDERKVKNDKWKADNPRSATTETGIVTA